MRIQTRNIFPPRCWPIWITKYDSGGSSLSLHCASSASSPILFLPLIFQCSIVSQLRFPVVEHLPVFLLFFAPRAHGTAVSLGRSYFLLRANPDLGILRQPSTGLTLLPSNPLIDGSEPPPFPLVNACGVLGIRDDSALALQKIIEYELSLLVCRGHTS